MWIFGYGSLIWRPDFPHVARAPAVVEGWQRRFYQGSPDHRGVPGAPGRVVTLVPESGARCEGVLYQVAPAQLPSVLRALDIREQGGYERQQVLARPSDGSSAREATTWVAGPENPHYLGPAPLGEMVAQIARSVGPSGPNDEYVIELARYLVEQGVDDPHVAELAAALEERSEAEPEAR